MPRPSHPLVLRGPAWLGSPWSIALGVSLVLATLVGVYAIGRAQAAFEGRAAFADEAGLRAALTAREVEVTRLRREVAELDTLKVAQERERQEVSRTIGELQAEVARQSQQLELLRGVVGRAGPAAEVTIRQVRVIASAAPGRYRLRIALAQPGRPDRTVSGSVRVGIEGQRGGRTARLGANRRMRRFGSCRTNSSISRTSRWRSRCRAGSRRSVWWWMSARRGGMCRQPPRLCSGRSTRRSILCV